MTASETHDHAETSPPPNSAFSTFADASRAVLDFLQKRFRFQTWMLTRVHGDDWMVLGSAGTGYGASAGDMLRWSDSICSRMVRGEGPNAAPSVHQIPAYTHAPITVAVGIRAYIGVPVTDPQGHLYGTLCAIDPQPADPTITPETAMLELLARLLGTILDHELRAAESHRHKERQEEQPFTDSQTGLYNRNAWERFLRRENDRSRTYGEPAAVLVVTLHQPHGPSLIAATRILAQAAGDLDIAARTADDELALLLIARPTADTQAISESIRRSLTEQTVTAGVGIAHQFRDADDLEACWRQATRQAQSQHTHLDHGR